MSSNVKQQEFIQRLIDKGDRTFSNSSFVDYLLSKIYVRSSMGVHRYSFDGHAYLEQIARKLEKTKNIFVMKGGQVAISTLMLAETFWRMEQSPMKCAWYFPDGGNMKIFVQDRVDEMIKNSPHIQKNVDQTNSIKNVNLLKYLDATLAFRATETLKQVKTYDSDGNWRDEYDEQNQEHAEFSNDRLDHSTMAISRTLSQPSDEDFGIHAEYKNSNQEMFLIKCEACPEWNNLVQRFIDDPGSIFGVKTGKNAKVVYACIRCGSALNPQKGIYVPAFPKHHRTGIQVAQFFNTIKTPEQHYIRWKEAITSIKKKNYFISVVGWPYSTDDEKPITQSLLDSMRGDHGIPDGVNSFTYMGADQGDTVHMLFGEHTSDNRIKIYPAKFSVINESEINRAIEKFQVYSGILDAMPNKNWSVRTAQRYSDFIRIQYFSKRFSTKDESIVSEDESEGIQVVNVNRDESLQDTVDAIKNGKFLFPDKTRLSGSDLELAEELDLHLKMLIKERGEDENGKPKHAFKKRVPNHFGMALNSLRLAFELGPP
ncbi:phage terminase large subunit family protein [Leptospira santarosai]|uniref:phage terminase large subunit family protein n=1 Tax=Leptospira santarosai TaxID=28183 RepID=UPI0002C02812|nr:phage terminase large subunit family protein [Leptospira santarosai]EMO69879.1 putative phage terminase large subunit GpA [Leptospira santarosai str. 200403458]EMO97943.1 putative phage terminase large subunit GpA [Leptospira santarosai str. 200702252]